MIENDNYLIIREGDMDDPPRLRYNMNYIGTNGIGKPGAQNDERTDPGRGEPSGHLDKLDLDKIRRLVKGE